MAWEEVERERMGGGDREEGECAGRRAAQWARGRRRIYGFGIFHSLIMAHPKKRKSSEKGWKVPGRSAGNDQRYVPSHILSSTPSEVQTRHTRRYDAERRGSSANRNACTHTNRREPESEHEWMKGVQMARCAERADHCWLSSSVHSLCQ